MNFQRLRGLVRKEAFQILRDPSSLMIAFLLPVILLLLFGYGISLDAKHVPIAFVVAHPSSDATSFESAFAQSEYFIPRRMRSMQEAELAMLEGDVEAIVYLQSDFASRLRSPRGAQIQLVQNGTDANTAGAIQGYVEASWALWQSQRHSGSGSGPPVRIESRVWYNANLSSRNYVVPGLIAVIMTLIGTILTALVIAREWERGTMEGLLVTPASMTEILLGKTIPYFVLGMVGMTLSVAMARWLFDIPIRGSLLVLFTTSALFLVVALTMGLLISLKTRNQFVAGLVAIIASFLPAFILSGFIFDIASMPALVRLLTYLVPARYFVAILQTVFLTGDVWSVILPNALGLLALATVLLTIAHRWATKRLE